MSLERLVIFAVLFLFVYHASEGRTAFMTAYREQKMRNTGGRYEPEADTVWWESVHVLKTAMVWMAVGQMIYIWVEAQPWFVR